MTKAQNNLLEAWREEIRDRLEDGVTTSQGADYNQTQAAALAGQVSVIKHLMDLDYAGLVTGAEK